jgi:hypothetical protein
MATTPAPAIGLRRAVRTTGEPFLHGIAECEFIIPVGARVQLRRVRPDGANVAKHVVVFAVPDPRLPAADLTPRVPRCRAPARRRPRPQRTRSPMTITATPTRSTHRLFDALVPATWPERAALLDAATRFDMRNGTSNQFLRAWSAWRASGQLPADALLRELVAGAAAVLGGVGPELRLRPRTGAR